MRQLFRLPRQMVSKIAQIFYHHRNITPLSFTYPQYKPAMDLVRQIKQKTKLLFNYNEAYNIYSIAKSVRKIPGDIVEVGVYEGGSGLLLSEIKEGKSLHLFDTFEGLPEVNPGKDSPGFMVGQFAASYEKVKALFEGKNNVNIYKGYFPKSAQPIEDKCFSFAHLDVDIYESTLESLKFLYPRMNRGGCILSHDFDSNSGVYKAFYEFFEDKPEVVIEMPISQCLVVKL